MGIRSQLSHYFTYQTATLDGSLIEGPSSPSGHYIRFGSESIELEKFEVEGFVENINRDSINTVITDDF